MKKTHYRICHVCGGLNMSQGSLVKKCDHCGRHLASFYFFDEERALGLKPVLESKTEEEVMKSRALPFQEYPPIAGITAYWD